MSHVRKVTHKSGAKSWQATIKTLNGKRKSKNFDYKADAENWARKNDGAAATGSADMTVIALAEDHNRDFDALVKRGERGQRTLDGYGSHLDNHIRTDPIGKMTLAAVDTPAVQALLSRIIIGDLEAGEPGSAETARRVKTSISTWFEHAQRKGWMAHNPAKAAKVSTKKRRRRGAPCGPLPAKAVLQDLLRAAGEGEHAARDSAVVHLLMFAGPRISELLGAADHAAELTRTRPDGSGGGGLFKIRERLCSRHVTLGNTKSEDGEREIPLGPHTASSLRTHRAARGAVPVQLVNGERVAGRLFPPLPGGRHGPFWSYSDFRRQCWDPMMIRAGQGVTVMSGRFKRVNVAFSPHTLRHVFASIQIENGASPKRLQQLMGHATLAMTMDLYGHLWTDPGADQAMAAASEGTIFNAVRR